MTQMQAKIAYFCRLNGITIIQLAQTLGIHPSTLRSYCRGVSNPPSAIREKAANVLGVTPEALWSNRKLIVPTQRKSL